MMQKNFIAGLIAGGILLSGLTAVVASDVTGSGKMASEKRKVGNYHAIRLNVPAEMLAQVGTAGDLNIQADDNVLPHLKTTVSNGELLITSDGTLHNVRKISIEAKTAKLDALSASGAANINVKGMSGGNLSVNAAGASSIAVDGKVDKFKGSLQGASKLRVAGLSGSEFGVTADGGSDISADGKVDKLSATLNGACSLKAAGLTARTASISISGAGNAEVNASSELNASISGVGNIKYKGNPKITKSIAGLGSIQKF